MDFGLWLFISALFFLIVLPIIITIIFKNQQIKDKLHNVSWIIFLINFILIPISFFIDRPEIKLSRFIICVIFYLGYLLYKKWEKDLDNELTEDVKEIKTVDSQNKIETGMNKRLIDIAIIFHLLLTLIYILDYKYTIFIF